MIRALKIIMLTQVGVIAALLGEVHKFVYFKVFVLMLLFFICDSSSSSDHFTIWLRLWVHAWEGLVKGV